MPDDQKQTPKIYVMPEQFLALTRAARIPTSRASVSAPAPLPPPMPYARASVPAAPVAAPTPAASSMPAPASAPKPSAGGVPVIEEKRSKVFLIWGIIGVVVLIGGGLAAFFALRSVPPPPAPAPRPAAPPPAPASTPPPVNVAPVPVPTSPIPATGGSASGGNAPSSVPPTDSVRGPTYEDIAPDIDTELDGLTDAEEILLGTNIASKDTDSDGYDDALEIANLYNPAGVAPQQIIDTELVYEYEHPTQGWSAYLPRQWSIVATDQDQRQFIVSTGVEGERLIIDGHANPERFSVREAAVRLWPAIQQPDPALVSTFITKRGANAARLTNDARRVLVAVGADRVVIVSHDTRADDPPRYPHLFDLVIQSFAAPAAPVSP